MAVLEVRVFRLSIDARRKPDVWFVYTLLALVDDEAGVLNRNIPDVTPYVPPDRYEFPSYMGESLEIPVVVVGTGPAGLFAALCLAEAGLKCVILERGQPVDRRIDDVMRFWNGGGLCVSSNVCFGEGGAGTFSDGKLSTGINDERVRFVLESLVRFGAPEEILYLAKPHIGTDRLRGVVRSIRERLIGLGCDIRFGHVMTDIDVSGGLLKSIAVRNGGGTYSIAADKLVLAPGCSARDTFEMLLRRGVRLSPKAFSVGVRIEHLQRDIDIAQYGDAFVSRGGSLPAADYKLAVPACGDRKVYTFCVCPGGAVVSSSSETGGVVTNGMSHFARDGSNCNGALLFPVSPDDYGHKPLDGVMFQRRLERDAFAAGGGNYFAPAQLVGDFLERRASTGHGRVIPTYLPGVRYCNLWDVLPDFVCEALHTALPEFSRRVAGFNDPDAVLTAVETRSSSPVRIEREYYEAVGVRGVFPCGDGAGYAGGIMSAAVDGIKCAEAILNRLPRK